MADESVSATTTIDAPADVIFGVLADPAKHAAIDGTGWVREPLDSQPLTAAGQIFRMAMYHENHPDGGYQMANRVQVFDPPSAISWEPGYDSGDGVIWKGHKISTVSSNFNSDGFGGGFIGDYTGNIWSSTNLHASWMDTRTGVSADETGGIAT